MDLPKPRNWSPITYLLVAVVLSFFTIVAWPLVRKFGENRLAAEADTTKPDLSAPTPPRTTGEPVTPAPGSKPRPEDRPPVATTPIDPKPPAITPTPPVVTPPVVAPPADPQPTPARFRDVAIDEPFDAVFAKSKTLMDTPQVREFTLPNGRPAIVCVVQAKLAADTGAGKVDAEKVCSAKMAAALLAWKKGLDTARTDIVDAATEKVDGSIVTAMRGNVMTLPPVGRWTSAKGDVLFMAFGKVFAPNELKP